MCQDLDKVRTDDVALLESNEKRMKYMLERFKRNLRMKGLELSVDESEVMIFRK